MYCKYCGELKATHSPYCPKCGKKLNINTKKKIEQLDAFSQNIKENITSEQSELNNADLKVRAANEIMINLRAALISLVIGFLSYFIFLNINEINKFDNFDYSKVTFEGGHGMEPKIVSGFPFDKFFDGEFLPNDIDGLKAMVERRNERVKEASQNSAVYIFIILLMILIIGRYTYKGLNWVYINSNKTS